MKKFIKLLVSLLMFIFLIAGCSSQDSTDLNKTIKIGILRIDDSLPFLVAEKENLYEKYGVDVEIIPFGSAREKDLALEAGQIDGDMTDLVVTGLLKKGGTDVKVVSLAFGATPQEGRFCILAAPNNDINSPADLKDVPIAISNNTMIHYLADNMTQEVGLSKEDVQTQSIPDLKLRLDALLSGKDTQAALLPDPLASLAELQGAKVIIDDTKLETNLSQSVVIFREDVIKKYPEKVAAVMKAHQEGATLLNEEPENYRDFIVENSRIPQPLLESYPSPTYTPGSLPTEENIERVMNWMVEKDLLEKTYSYEELVTDQFIK